MIVPFTRRNIIKVFVFDLDGTLAISKGPIDRQMIQILKGLLEHHIVCVVSGGKWQQFKDQMIDHLVDSGGMNTALLNNLHCFPTSGTTYYRHARLNSDDIRQYAQFDQVYNLALTKEEKVEILVAFDVALAETGYDVVEPYGDVIEDRETQITFSALGQEAPHELKKGWDPLREKRRAMMDIMQPMLPGFDVRLGGTTSVDVTRKGCDKRLAIKKILEHFPVMIQDLVFFGDALEPGGNDHAVYEYGVECIPVDNHIDCAWKVRQYVKTLGAQ
ncbi:MAG: HAD-IIB family hydrolase [Candidatus Thorarchaeota archaeon]|jgi:HAD superfamily hydrolase (TIGR01484 family)